jgi:tetratricopeptide (TPR) repeat protein
MCANLRGRFDEAVVLDRRAVHLDPLSDYAYRHYGIDALRAGLPDEALMAARRAVELQPNAPLVHGMLGLVYLYQGRAKEALAEMERETKAASRLTGLAKAYHALGRQEAADRALKELVEDFGDNETGLIASAYAFRGETDRAFEWLERAYARKNPGIAWLKIYPEYRSLYDDPRWKPFLEKVGLPADDQRN